MQGNWACNAVNNFQQSAAAPNSAKQGVMPRAFQTDRCPQQACRVALPPPLPVEGRLPRGWSRSRGSGGGRRSGRWPAGIIGNRRRGVQIDYSSQAAQDGHFQSHIFAEHHYEPPSSINNPLPSCNRIPGLACLHFCALHSLNRCCGSRIKASKAPRPLGCVTFIVA